jgi:Membrane protein involved in the export of O-antigen and teichoic acid
MMDKKRTFNYETRTITANVVISLMNTIVSMIFPLITYPYISRVLHVDNIGAVNFGTSIIEYFGVFAAFGISGFAIRNGAAVRNDSVKLLKLVSQVFSINVITTFISVLSLLGMLLWSKQLENYRTIILIQSLTLIVSPLTLEWLYSIYEDFLYIAIRNLMVRILCLIAIFAFVKNESDVYIYVFISSVSTVITSIINFVHSRKYIYISFTFKNDWCVHKKSLIIFLINSISSTIYLNSDKTMLGIFCGDQFVGLYTTATNIYMIVKRIVAAGVTVTIPRLSFYFQDDMDRFNSLVTKGFKTIIFVTLPMASGLTILAPETVYIISGKGYENAKTPLIVLAVAIIFASIANLCSNGVLLSQKKENIVMRCTILSSIVNIIFNFVMIPLFQETGAAITTLLAEIIMASMSMHYSGIKLLDKQTIITFLKTFVSTMIMVIACLCISSLNGINMYIRTAVVVFVGIMTFISMALLLREEIVIIYFNSIKNRIRNKIEGKYK